MEFTKQEYNKKFAKNHFELSELLKINNTKNESSTKNQNNTNEENNSNTNTETNNNQTDTNTNNTSNDNKNNTDENNTTTNEETNDKPTNNNSTTNENTDNTTKRETTASATIDDVIYPMYLPSNTYLTSQETIDTENGQRLILTFGGDSSFILVEETVQGSEEGIIIPVSGEFDFLSDVIGVIGTNSLSWHSNGIDYYMASESITTAELVEIARSISVLPVSK